MLGGGVAFLLFFSGLAMASAPSAAFIHKTMFLWVALMAGPFLGERLGWAPIAALGLILLGQVLILPPLGITWGTGETLIAIATGLWAVEVVLARRVLGRVRSPIVGVARLGIGLVVLVGFLVVTGRIAGIADLDGTAWLWIAITGMFLSGYVGTWLAALGRAPATEVTSILVVGALITGALTAISRGAVPDPMTAGGYMLVAIAVVGLAGLGLATLGTGRRLGRKMAASSYVPPPARERIARAPASGPVLFARYAYGPNRYGYCGPDDADELLEAGAAGQDRVLRDWPASSKAPTRTSL